MEIQNLEEIAKAAKGVSIIVAAGGLAGAVNLGIAYAVIKYDEIMVSYKLRGTRKT